MRLPYRNLRPGPLMKTVAITLTLVPVLAFAQGTKPSGSGTSALTEAQQIASAVLPLPKEFRDGATVLGYRSGSTKLSLLKKGQGDFTCLASNPSSAGFHLACYHNSLEQIGRASCRERV